MSRSDRLPLWNALLRIFLTTLLLSGTSYIGWWMWEHHLEKRLTDPRYELQALRVLASPEDHLPSSLLAHWLDLSPHANLYSYDCHALATQLFRQPLIAHAVVQRDPPHRLLVEYSLRKPIARLAEVPQVGLDEEGILIPLIGKWIEAPLPSIFIGLPPSSLPPWEQPSPLAPRKEGARLLKLIQTTSLGEHLLRIDSSAIDAPSKGRRQLLLILEESWGVTLIRLMPETIKDGIKRYLALRSLLEEMGTPQVVDLRLDQLAYLQPPPHTEKERF